MQELFPENSKNAQQVNGVRRNLMKKKIIYVLITFINHSTGSEAKCMTFKT